MSHAVKDYFRRTFVRKKPNASGIISIQIIDKSRGDYQMIKTIGSSADPAEVESLFAEGKKWINTHLGQQDIFEQADQAQEEKQTVEYVFSHIENILPYLIPQQRYFFFTKCNRAIFTTFRNNQFIYYWLELRIFQIRIFFKDDNSFRVTKGTVELRPMFHFTAKRIEAYVTICFVAFKVYKELERIVKLKGIKVSVDKVLDIAKTITTIKVRLPKNNTVMTKTMLITPKQKSIASLIYDAF